MDPQSTPPANDQPADNGAVGDEPVVPPTPPADDPGGVPAPEPPAAPAPEEPGVPAPEDPAAPAPGGDQPADSNPVQ